MTKKKQPSTGKAREEQKSKSHEEELIVQLQRLQAEFENYKRRTEQEQAAYRQYASGEALQGLLPIVDNFELALINAKEGEKDPFYKGIELIYAQLKEYLESNGISEIKATGTFDPTKHEAMISEQVVGKKSGEIIEILQKGYEMNGKVLRTAKVKVTK